MNKKALWAIVILVVLAAILGGWYCYKIWWPQRQAMISLGLAESKFPWRNYTQDELNKLYPQIRYADVPTRVTPEQTYANFREALRTNNLELALEQLGKDAQGYAENLEKLKNAYEENKFISSINLYPENFWRSTFGPSVGSLCYEQLYDNKKIVGCTSFIKDANGDWKMDSL
ncbi:hypothetical protein KJ590_02765 [Patescibacteria group bacterium]|nr:hypothetical protein [Patescibacteria group bacterium]